MYIANVQLKLLKQNKISNQLEHLELPFCHLLPVLLSGILPFGYWSEDAKSLHYLDILDYGQHFGMLSQRNRS
jgi:hypothetical protein